MVAEQEDSEIIELSDGDHFGEQCLLRGTIRRCTATSVHYVWLFVLTKKAIGTIVSMGLEMAEEVRSLFVI